VNRPNRTEKVLDCLDAIGALGLVRPERLPMPPRQRPHERTPSDLTGRIADIDVQAPPDTSAKNIGWILDPVQPASDRDREEREVFIEELGPIEWDPTEAPEWPPDRKMQGATAVDVGAWYSPIHVYAGDWGIYIRKSAITQIAADLMLTASSLGFRDKIDEASKHEFVRAAVLTLFHHETYHHMVESFIIRMEILLRDGGRWELYHREVYLRQLGRDIGPNEEALANAYQLRRARRAPLPVWLRKSLLEYLPVAFSQQGPGYNRGALYQDSKSFTSLERFLMSEIETGPFTEERRPSSSWLPFGMMTSLLNCEPHTYFWPA